jgi:hypothetical protein
MAQTGILLAHGRGVSRRQQVGRLLQMGAKELVVQKPGQLWYGKL